MLGNNFCRKFDIKYRVDVLSFKNALSLYTQVDFGVPAHLPSEWYIFIFPVQEFTGNIWYANHFDIT